MEHSMRNWISQHKRPIIFIAVGYVVISAIGIAYFGVGGFG